MYSKSAGIKYVKEYLRVVKANNIKVDRAILFGSYAKNKANRFSDIDLAIITNIFNQDPLKNRSILTPINIKFTKIEPHTFTIKDFKKSDPFIEEILKTGIEIPIV